MSFRISSKSGLADTLQGIIYIAVIISVSSQLVSSIASIPEIYFTGLAVGMLTIVICSYIGIQRCDWRIRNYGFVACPLVPSIVSVLMWFFLGYGLV